MGLKKIIIILIIKQLLLFAILFSVRLGIKFSKSHQTSNVSHCNFNIITIMGNTIMEKVVAPEKRRCEVFFSPFILVILPINVFYDSFL